MLFYIFSLAWDAHIQLGKFLIRQTQVCLQLVFIQSICKYICIHTDTDGIKGQKINIPLFYTDKRPIGTNP